MVTGGPDVVNPYKFADIFMSYHKILLQMNVRTCMFYCHIVVLSYLSVVLYCHIVVLLCCDIVVLSYCSVMFYYHVVVFLYCDIAMLSYCSVVLMMSYCYLLCCFLLMILFILPNISGRARVHDDTERMLACRT
jgi:hypothetical protein